MNERFFQGIQRNRVRISVGELELPVQFQDAEAMISHFPAPTATLTALLTATDLAPVQVRPGVSLLGVAALEYKKSSIGAFNELAVFIPCLWRPATNWPLLPLLFPQWFPNLAAQVLNLAVSAEFACAARREIWGYPAFMAQVDFQDDGGRRVCTVTHEGMRILSYGVEKSEVPQFVQRSYPTFSQKGTTLLRTRMLTQGLLGISKLPTGSRLEFGPHPLGQQLAGLQPGPPRRSWYYPKLQSLIGWASKSYELAPRAESPLRGGLGGGPTAAATARRPAGR